MRERERRFLLIKNIYVCIYIYIKNRDLQKSLLNFSQMAGASDGDLTKLRSLMSEEDDYDDDDDGNEFVRKIEK